MENNEKSLKNNTWYTLNGGFSVLIKKKRNGTFFSKMRMRGKFVEEIEWNEQGINLSYCNREFDIDLDKQEGTTT
jgi:hypothetical protein